MNNTPPKKAVEPVEESLPVTEPIISGEEVEQTEEVAKTKNFETGRGSGRINHIWKDKTRQ